MSDLAEAHARAPGAEPILDLAFVLRGTTIAADHGFLLFGAVSRVVPAVHSDQEIGIHPIVGRPVGGRRVALTPESRLTLRMPVRRIPDVLPLAGKRLSLRGDVLMIGVPTTRPLRSAQALLSRLVVIKGFTDPDPFLEAARRQLSEMGVSGTPRLVDRRADRSLEGGVGAHDGPIRRTVHIRDKEIVGFALRVDDLTATDSLRLQAAGIGGRRRFGCGIFVPIPRQSSAV